MRLPVAPTLMALGCLLLVPPSALAQRWDSPACKADFARLCPGVEPGDGRLVQCIAKHLDELSLDCRAQAREGHQQLHATATAPSGTCLEDAKKYCAHIPHGSGGLFDCLQQKYLVLASGCQLLVQNMIQRMERVKDACKDDIPRFCADGGSPLVQCLGGHQKELAEGCRAVLTEGARPSAGPPMPPHGAMPPPAAQPATPR